jgi:hypothetical protein
MSSHKLTSSTSASVKEHSDKPVQNVKMFPLDANDVLRPSAAFFGLSREASDFAARMMRGSLAWRVI